jgi:hypothetical protein
MVVLPPASLDLGTIKLLPRGTGVPGGDDGVVFVYDDSSEVAPQTGSLMRTPVGQVEKVLMTISSHACKSGRGQIKKVTFRIDGTDPPGEGLLDT